MRVSLSPALVLHRRAWRETSLLVEAFAREHGRVGLVAKGARRPKARWRGLLEPLSRLTLSWAGRGELYTLTGAESLGRCALTGEALMAGLYANELVLRLTARGDPHPSLYDSLLASLDALGAGAPPTVALCFFERDLLAAIGYGLALETTGDGAPVAAHARYRYRPLSGLAAGPAAADEIAIGGRALLGLARGRFAHRDDVGEARALTAAAIAPLLGSRPLKSVQTLRAMRQFTAASRASIRPDPPTGDGS